MSAEGAFESGQTADPGVEAGATGRAAPGPQSLVAMRLTRELIAADTAADRGGEAARGRAGRLLVAALAALRLPGGAIVGCASRPGEVRCLAVHALAASATDLLEAPGGESLVERACTERRAFLLGRSSREALLSALRAELPQVGGAAVVPLYDRGAPVAALVLAASEEWPLDAAALRLLAPAFHLLGVLLSPGRGQGVAEAEAPADPERYSVELEELGERLREARLAAQAAAERAASVEAALRAEGEARRARVAELEARLSRGDLESSLRRDLESACEAQARQIAAREARIAELEDEVRCLVGRLAAESAAGAGRGTAAGPPRGSEPGDESLPASAQDDEGGLEEIAAAAVAALDDAASGGAPGAAGAGAAQDEPGEVVFADVDAEVEEGGEASVTVVELGSGDEASGDAGACYLVDLESDPAIRAALAEAALRADARPWDGEGAAPGGRCVIAVNVLALQPRRPAVLEAGFAEDVESVVYAYHPATGSGFELGTVGWLGRGLDAAAAAAIVRRAIAGRTGSVVIASSHMRELAPLREALAKVGLSSSVACDARQALDLLDIVGRPDALLVDPMLDDGQGLVLAAQLRRDADTLDVPLFLLLPAERDPERLLGAARRAGLLEPYGPGDAARLVAAVLARG